MEIRKYKTKKGEREALLVNVETDKCPVCDTPLSSVYFSWNIFHGEASSSCCGAPFQTKDYHIDEDEPEEYKNFVASLGKPLIRSKIDGKYLVAYRTAFSEGLPKDLNNQDVHKRVGEILEINETP